MTFENHTSDQQTSKIDAAIICYNRPDEVRAAVASCVGLGFDSILVLDNGSSRPVSEIPNCTLIRSEENLGVCGGRNLLLRHSDADYLLFLDDDALLDPRTNLDSIRALFGRSPQLAVIAGRISRENGDIARHEFPFRRVRRVHEERTCGYFVGACFAARRDALSSVGGFDENFFYAHEEADLALRLAREDWGIRYFPDLRATHLPSSLGRGPSIQSTSRQLANRLSLCAGSLPFVPRFTHKLIWRTYYYLQMLRVEPLQVVRFHSAVQAHLHSREDSGKRQRLSFLRASQLQLRGYRVFW